jgi:hypothetical protein
VGVDVTTPAPDWPAVIAWLRVNEWRYAKAARHFGLPVDEVRTVGKAARDAPPAAMQPPPLARAREDQPEAPDRRALLLARLAEVDHARLEALADPRGRTAYTKLLIAERDLRAELDELLAGKEDDGGVGDLDDEALLRAYTAAAETMPEAHIRAIVNAYLARHRLKLERDMSKTLVLGGGEEDADA